MAISYTWNFPTLVVVYSEDNLTNVVQTAQWALVGVDGNYTGAYGGSVDLGPPNPASFTPYDQLTQPQVQGWVEQALGQVKIDAAKADIADQIQKQKVAPTGALTPPWVPIPIE